MAATTKQLDLTEDAARGGGRGIPSNFQLTGALDTWRGTRFYLRDRRCGDLNGSLGRSARELGGQALRATHRLAERTLLFAPLPPRA